jgi:hypothetical protein
VDERRTEDPIEHPIAALRCPDQTLARLALALEQGLVERTPGLEARRVREEVPNRDALLVALRERR